MQTYILIILSLLSNSYPADIVYYIAYLYKSTPSKSNRFLEVTILQTRLFKDLLSGLYKDQFFILIDSNKGIGFCDIYDNTYFYIENNNTDIFFCQIPLVYISTGPHFRTFINLLNDNLPLVLYIDNKNKEILYICYSPNVSFSIGISYRTSMTWLAIYKFKKVSINRQEFNLLCEQMINTEKSSVGLIIKDDVLIFSFDSKKKYSIRELIKDNVSQDMNIHIMNNKILAMEQITNSLSTLYKMIRPQ